MFCSVQTTKNEKGGIKVYILDFSYEKQHCTGNHRLDEEGKKMTEWAAKSNIRLLEPIIKGVTRVRVELPSDSRWQDNSDDPGGHLLFTSAGLVGLSFNKDENPCIIKPWQI